MDYSGEASTSGRNGSEASSSSGRRRSREEFEGDDLEADMQMVLAGGPVPGPRGTYPKGRVLRTGFAEGWDGRTFRLAPTSHLSFRTLSGIGVSSQATRAFEPLFERQAQAEKIRSVQGMLQRFRTLFNLPSTIRASIGNGEYDLAIREYKKAKSIALPSHCISKSTIAAKDINRVREFWCRKFVEGMYT